MHAFLARIPPAVRANSPVPAEVPSARRQLHEVLTRLGDLGRQRDFRWWQGKLRE